MFDKEKEIRMADRTWFLASLAIIGTIIAFAMAAGRAGAQDAPQTPTTTAMPTATPTETPTCWYDGDQVFCLVPPVAVTATPTMTPTPTATETHLGPGPDEPGWANYLPVAFGQRFVNIQPRGTPEVSGDVR